jgi:hypothetical protein
MKNLAILMVALTMVSLADAEMILRIVDNGDGTCGIWSSGYNPGDDMYFALVTAAPPYPSGGYVTDIAPPGTIISPPPIDANLPLPTSEDGVWGYIGDPMGVGCPPGTYIDGIQVWLGAQVKLYKIAADWSSVTLLDTRTLREGDCLIGGIAGATEYADWVAWGKPNCWCYARQCRGNINGKKTGPSWINLLDLMLLSASFNKTDAQLALIPNGICADINHKKTGPYRVQLLDLQELAKYFNKSEAQVPVCDQPPLITGPYNFWTVGPP